MCKNVLMGVCFAFILNCSCSKPKQHLKPETVEFLKKANAAYTNELAQETGEAVKSIYQMLQQGETNAGMASLLRTLHKENKFAYVWLSITTPCPPRSAVSVNRADGRRFFHSPDAVRLGHGCDPVI
jgi:hypothetical protein